MQEIIENTPPEFSDAYHKARKHYGLFSGILLAWELIGVVISETPFDNIKIQIKSPQAIAYVLVVLVVYFAFRFTIEWYQTDDKRRQLLPSKIDYWIAHIIGGISIAIYAIQSSLKIQIANIQSSDGFGISAGVYIFVYSNVSLLMFLSMMQNKLPHYSLAKWSVIVSCFVILLIKFLNLGFGKYDLYMIPAGLILLIFDFLVLYRGIHHKWPMRNFL